MVNKLNAQIINKGTFTLLNGLGNRLINFGAITNTSGSFIVDSGKDTAFINYASGTLVNHAAFTVQYGENVRLYNLGAIENNAGSFSIGGALQGVGFANGPNASFINKAGVTILGGVGAQLINDGLVENQAGTFSIDGSSFLDYVAHNRSRIVNKTGATFTISGGNGSRLINDSIVINDGTFTLKSGGNDGTKPSLYNGVNDTIRNTGTLTVRGGFFTTLLNCGVVQNLGGMTVGAGTDVPGYADKGITLHNKGKISNETGAKIDFATGTNYGILNDSVIINNGLLKCDQGAGRPSLKNSVGDTIISQGEILIQGVGGGNDLNSLGDAGFVNEGYFEFYDKLTVQSLGVSSILNSGIFLGKPGSAMALRYGVSISPLFYNAPDGQVTLEGTTDLNYSGGGGIVNYGRFKQLGGIIMELVALGNAVFTNHHYMEIRDVPTFKVQYLDTLFVNTDSLIIGAIPLIEVNGISHFMTNRGYCLNQANFNMQASGSNGILNEGTFVNEADIDAYYMSDDKPFIDNKSGAAFFQKGKIRIFSTDATLINNAGYFANSGSFKVSNVNGYASNSAIVNSDTLINEGVIEMDTLGNHGIDNSKYFRNSREGKIYADYVRKNGIYNTGDAYNFGEIWMARDTGIGEAGIYSAKLFDNCGLINIGTKGPLFGGGIVNDATGVFNNRPTAHIVINNADSTAILNKGTSFTNGLCALIEVGTPIVDQSNSFTNYGIIVQNQDTSATLVADIDSNAGTIYDLDPESFNITNNSGSVLNSLPMGGVSASSISFTTSTPQLCPGDTAKFVVEATCPAGPFDLVIGYNGIDTLIQNYTSGDTIRIKFLSDADFVLKSIDVDGQGQVEKDIPALEISTGPNCCPIITASIDFLAFLCQDSTILLSSTVTGGTGPYTYTWTQTGGAGSVQIMNHNDGTASAKGLGFGAVEISLSVQDVNGCMILSPATRSLTVVDCSETIYKIDDPCTCKGNSLFDEEVTVSSPFDGETWTVVAIAADRMGGVAPGNVAVGNTLTYNNMTKKYEIAFVHTDSSGYKMTVEGPNALGSPGNVRFSVDNICYYPDVAINSLPALVSPNSAPFTVTGTAANNATGTGSFVLNGASQAGSSPSPTKLTINPGALPLGLNTLKYSFDADTTGGKNLADPGCVSTVEQTFQVAACGCSRVNVTLDPQTCTYALEAKNLVLGNCEAATVRVVDNNPSNGNIIDCAGEWTYGLFDGLGNLICWGKVVAEDKSAPLYTSWIGKCNVGTLAVPGQTELLNGQFTNSTAAFLCLNAEELFNKENTWKDATSALFAGRPVFADACHNDYCKCSTTLKATDELTYFTCDEIGSAYPGVPSGYEAWARLKRTFTATDCYGNFVQGYQHIYLVRPQAVTFGNELLKSLKAQVAGKCDAIVEDFDAPKDNCCGEVDYELDLACLVGGDKCAAPTAEEMLRLFKTKLRIQDSLDCVTDRGYAFFAEGADSKYKLLGCNYSFDAQVEHVPGMRQRKKVLVKLSYFDWCNPGEEHGLRTARTCC
ncbi:MAG: hypothetical protein IPK21_14370 [Haliscomenobacter sp.]|nr:hypothetical protein [Haliscomenobacter sp.]